MSKVRIETQKNICSLTISIFSMKTQENENIYFYLNGMEEDAQEYITKTENRLKSKLTPSKTTKDRILDHAGEIQTPEEWWNTQDNKNTEMDVSS